MNEKFLENYLSEFCAFSSCEFSFLEAIFFMSFNIVLSWAIVVFDYS